MFRALDEFSRHVDLPHTVPVSAIGGRENISRYFQIGSVLDSPPGSTERPPDSGLPAGGRKKHSNGDVVLWAACLDSGNSHEVVTTSGAHKVYTARSPAYYSL